MTLETRFARMGTEVPAEDVPGLVAAGRTVWSFGYGRDNDPEAADGFDAIEESDLWLFDEDLEDARESWGPFRVDPTD